MPVDISQLKQSLNKIKQIGYQEDTFDVDGMQLTLRTLASYEEVEADQWAGEALEEANGEQDVAAFNLWMDRLKIGCLSYSIVAIDDLNLREEEYVQDGVDQNGKAILRPRHEAVRKLVASWSRTLLQVVFSKYGELLSQAESEIFKRIHVEPHDLDSEVQRLEARVKELRDLQDKKQRQVDQETHSVAQAQKLIEHGNLRHEVHQEVQHSSAVAQAEEAFAAAHPGYQPETPPAVPQQPAPMYRPPTAAPPVRPTPPAAPAQPAAPTMPAPRAPRTLRDAAGAAVAAQHPHVPVAPPPASQGPTLQAPASLSLGGQEVPMVAAPRQLLESVIQGKEAPQVDAMPAQGGLNPRFRGPQQR